MADLHVARRDDDFGMATIMARKGIGAGPIGVALGIEAPTMPSRRVAETGLSLIGTGAGTWLAHLDGAGPFWAEELRGRLAGLASVSDQSGAYALYRLAGGGARTLLQRGLAIDLHPAAFGPGAAATSVVAHIGVVVWLVDERPTYDVALYRSFAGSFEHWIEEASPPCRRDDQ